MALRETHFWLLDRANSVKRREGKRREREEEGGRKEEEKKKISSRKIQGMEIVWILHMYGLLVWKKCMEWYGIDV